MSDCRSMSQSAGLSISCLRYETAEWNESFREVLRRVEITRDVMDVSACLLCDFILMMGKDGGIASYRGPIRRDRVLYLGNVSLEKREVSFVPALPFKTCIGRHSRMPM
ncbi:hypothetical protein J6590_093479 [Homalodisca vitripennis]|nr:hypothetical protein J6590_093479 [Homalodisca vitripennis]